MYYTILFRYSHNDVNQVQATAVGITKFCTGPSCMHLDSFTIVLQRCQTEICSDVSPPALYTMDTLHYKLTDELGAYILCTISAVSACVTINHINSYWCDRIMDCTNWENSKCHRYSLLYCWQHTSDNKSPDCLAHEHVPIFQSSNWFHSTKYRQNVSCLSHCIDGVLNGCSHLYLEMQPKSV